ncbi:unnamed protein product [Paramecium sonneborni]|uniref:Uncharacterized protein n=1 Tax=Paramecium sonneborni TaxID=65129 RepID=A0A8S1PTW7_9CILI|nr:unnamed protein product [Paramecium sonneborni]
MPISFQCNQSRQREKMFQGRNNLLNRDGDIEENCKKIKKGRK